MKYPHHQLKSTFFYLTYDMLNHNMKNLKIQIKTLDDSLNQFTHIAEKVIRGKPVKKVQATYLADAATARSIFTEGRIKIIQILKKKKIHSIYELAKIVNRDFKNVYDDVQFLSEIGIIAIHEKETKRKQNELQLICDEIIFDLAA